MNALSLRSNQGIHPVPSGTRPHRWTRRCLIATVTAALVVLLLLVGGCSRQEPTRTAAKDDTATGMAMSEGEFTVDPRQQQLIGVTYGVAERRDVERTIRTVGTIDYDESLLTDVTLKIGGWIEELFVDQTGALVETGQRLFTIYSPDLIESQTEYLLAFDAYQAVTDPDSPTARDARQLLDASRQRLEYWNIEERHITDLEKDRTIRRTVPIHSPGSGYVIEKNIIAGAQVNPGQLVYRLADLDTVWVLADIYEYELPYVTVDQEAEVTLSYLPGESFAGRVTYIYPYLEPQERTVKVRIELPNPEHRLKIGMYADVILRAQRRDVLVVPQAAVLDSGRRQVVFLSLGEGRFQPREVTLGARIDDSSLEILDGVTEGDRIATSAIFLLDSESQLSAGMRQMKH